MAQVGWTPRPSANVNTPKPRMRSASVNTPKPRMRLAGAKFISSLCGYHLSKRERERKERKGRENAREWGRARNQQTCVAT